MFNSGGSRSCSNFRSTLMSVMMRPPQLSRRLRHPFLSRCFCWFLWLTVIAALPGRAAESPASRSSLSLPDKDSPEMEWWRDSMQTREQRLQWWREARFGMFVHWGVYSALGGTWQGHPVKGYAEHIQRMLKIPIPVYREQVAGEIKPTALDAGAGGCAGEGGGLGGFIFNADANSGVW